MSNTPVARVASLHDQAAARAAAAHAAAASHSGVTSSSVNTAILAALIITALYVGQPVFIPLVTAILIAFILSPLVQLLRRVRLPRSAAVILVVAATLGAFIGLGTVIGGQFRELAGALPQYETTLRDKVRDLRGVFSSPGALDRAAETLQDLKKELEEPAAATPPVGEAPKGSAGRTGTSGGAPSSTQPMLVEVRTPEPKPLEYVLLLMKPLVQPVIMVMIVVVLVLFMLIQKEELRDRFIRLVHSGDLQTTTAAMTDAGTRLSRFLLNFTLLNAGYGAFIALVLWALGLPAPMLWGILAALMRFVPILGSFIAGVFPVMLAAAVDPGWTTFGITLTLFVISEATMGQLIEPLVQGRTAGLSPLAVLIATAFWTFLWGPVGLLLAVPITLCLVVLGQYVDSLRFVHVLFGDQPALSLPERFYQRTLAGDAVEISELAEQRLREEPLSVYYSEVALNALRLAQTDSDNGRIEVEHMETVADTVETMVDNLWEWTDEVPKGRGGNGKGQAASEEGDEAEEDEEDICQQGACDLPVIDTETLPKDWRGEDSVVIVSAGTALDRAAAALVSHVLDAHGIESSRVDGDELRGVVIAAHELERARLVCICTVGAGIGPTRYLARRIRRRKGGIAIVGALLGASDNQTATPDTAAVANLDAMTTSLRDTISFIIETVREGAEEARGNAVTSGEPEAARVSDPPTTAPA